MSKPWWDNKYGKNAICGITKTRLRPGKDKNGKSYIVKLPCEHYFYRKSLIEWIHKSKIKVSKLIYEISPENGISRISETKCTSTCPLCRKIFYLKLIKEFKDK